MIFPLHSGCVQNRDMVLGREAGRTASVLAIWLLMVCCPAGFCQQSQNATPGSSSANSQSQPNPPTDKRSGADDNPFPAAQSQAAANAAAQQHQPSTPQSNTSQNAGAGSSQKKRSASQDNPFPEAQSKAAARAGNGAAEPNRDSSSSGAAGGYSSSDANLPPTDLGQGDFRSHQKLDTFTRDQTVDGRIEDDLKVASLYMGTGNYRGALLRYQDAIQYDPQNDTALFGIAYAMCKENLTADAMARFKSYATTNPQGKYAVKAEKMLAHPNKCMHNF
jgi:hypothetical protein